MVFCLNFKLGSLLSSTGRVYYIQVIFFVGVYLLRTPTATGFKCFQDPLNHLVDRGLASRRVYHLVVETEPPGLPPGFQ